MLDEAWLGELLMPYGISLDKGKGTQVLSYLALLGRWNQRVNLVSAASPETWIRRHFAESLYLSRVLSLEGRLLDVGSGAGFPAIPLKLVFPALSVTLLEPIAKKRAFLKEVCRVCGLADVEVRPERIEDFKPEAKLFTITTSRAVGHFREIVPRMIKLLTDHGKIFLWVSAKQRQDLEGVAGWVNWQWPIEIPGTDQSQIWHGTRKILPASDGTFE